MYTSPLTNGSIPARNICPYREKCPIAQAGGCNHKGEKHKTAFSCAAARGFDIVDRGIYERSIRDPLRDRFVALIKMKQEIILLCDDQTKIQIFSSKPDGIKAFEQAYNRAHHSEHEYIIAACLHLAIFQPSILHLRTGKADVEALLDAKQKLTCNRYSFEAGVFYGVPLDRIKGLVAWNAGEKPRVSKRIELVPQPFEGG
jgi:hypothetical protein